MPESSCNVLPKIWGSCNHVVVLDELVVLGGNERSPLGVSTAEFKNLGVRCWVPLVLNDSNTIDSLATSIACGLGSSLPSIGQVECAGVAEITLLISRGIRVGNEI